MNKKTKFLATKVSKYCLKLASRLPPLQYKTAAVSAEQTVACWTLELLYFEQQFESGW